jgi:anti-sigma regulatory factor (Ser/Thr protein kinase)
MILSFWQLRFKTCFQEALKHPVFTLRFLLSSDLLEIDRFCERVRHLLTDRELYKLCFAVDIVLREFLNNAHFHGNKCDIKKQIMAEIRIKENRIAISVADQGEGFNVKKLSSMIPDKDLEQGRGIYLSKMYADHIIYNLSGNRVNIGFKIN